MRRGQAAAVKAIACVTEVLQQVGKMQGTKKNIYASSTVVHNTTNDAHIVLAAIPRRMHRISSDLRS